MYTGKIARHIFLNDLSWIIFKL